MAVGAFHDHLIMLVFCEVVPVLLPGFNMRFTYFPITLCAAVTACQTELAEAFASSFCVEPALSRVVSECFMLDVRCSWPLQAPLCFS